MGLFDGRRRDRSHLHGPQQPLYVAPASSEARCRRDRSWLGLPDLRPVLRGPSLVFLKALLPKAPRVSRVRSGNPGESFGRPGQSLLTSSPTIHGLTDDQTDTPHLITPKQDRG